MFFASYQIIRSIPTGNSQFRIVTGPEIVDGIIPFFGVADFQEIAEKITEFNLEGKKARSYVYINENGERVNKLRPDYDNSRLHYSLTQLNNIGVMLLRFINDQDMGNAPIPKLIGSSTPRVSGDRIILSGMALTDNNLWPEQNGMGFITLSIAPKGTINYFFQLTKVNYEGRQQPPLYKPIYKTLTISFPLK